MGARNTAGRVTLLLVVSPLSPYTLISGLAAYLKNNTRIYSHVTNIMYIRNYVFIENQTEAIGNSILFSMKIKELLSPPPPLPNLLIYYE